MLESRRSPDGSEEWLNWVVREKESNAAVGTLQATIAGDRAFVAWVIATQVARPWVRGRSGCRVGLPTIRRPIDSFDLRPHRAGTRRLGKGRGARRSDIDGRGS